MKVLNVLSIDFDYWINQAAAARRGFNQEEADYFINKAWGIRAAMSPTFRDETKVRGNPLLLWSRLKEVGCKFDLVAAPQVHDSHAKAWDMLSDNRGLNIINIDSHHDTWYSKTLRGLEQIQIDCGNWIGKLALDGRVNRVTQVYPRGRRPIHEFYPNQGPFNKVLGGKWSIAYKLEPVLGDLTIHKVFICRSGAWTPPWADRTFVGFVEAMPPVLRDRLVNWRPADFIRPDPPLKLVSKAA